MGKGWDFYRGKGRVMHIIMHVKSTKRLPTHDVIYSIVQWMNIIGSVKCFIVGVVKLGNVRKTEETLPDFLQNV